jgi:hypothetical protein
MSDHTTTTDRDRLAAIAGHLDAAQALTVEEVDGNLGDLIDNARRLVVYLQADAEQPYASTGKEGAKEEATS